MDSLMFGHTLRMLRTTAGISLRSLAKKIDVSPAYLSQIELGKLNPPTHDRIKKIAETIGIPVSLLTEISHRPNPDVILLIQGHQELNELIRMAFDIGLKDRDIFEMIALMQRLGGSGFRKLMNYGVEHSSDFMQTGKSDLRVEISPYSLNQMSFSELANPRLVFKKLEFTDKNDLFLYMI
ncbi:MAG: helix-turn-helix domain-containing protein [Candidatus Aminicenantes bacterium]|nr:helix-turn-helix domain-containing protein [Candidatus Aminicenantes bacterium]